MPKSLNTNRICTICKKLHSNETTRFLLLGGSISAYGWPVEFKRLLVQQHAKATLVNRARGGLHSFYQSFCVRPTLEQDQADIVLLEFAVNDYYQLANLPVSSRAIGFESLVRQALNSSSSPGIIYVGMQDAHGNNALSWIKPILDHYSIPLLVPPPTNIEEYSPDTIHPKPATAKEWGRVIYSDWARLCNVARKCEIGAKMSIPAVFTPGERPLISPHCYSLLAPNSSDNLTIVENHGFKMETHVFLTRTDYKLSLHGNLAGAQLSLVIPAAERVWLMFYRNNETGNALVKVMDGNETVLGSYSVPCTFVADNWQGPKVWGASMSGINEEIFSLIDPVRPEELQKEVLQFFSQRRQHRPGQLQILKQRGYSIVELPLSNLQQPLPPTWKVDVTVGMATPACANHAIQVVALLTDHANVK